MPGMRSLKMRSFIKTKTLNSSVEDVTSSQHIHRKRVDGLAKTYVNHNFMRRVL